MRNYLKLLPVIMLLSLSSCALPQRVEAPPAHYIINGVEAAETIDVNDYEPTVMDIAMKRLKTWGAVFIEYAVVLIKMVAK